MALSRTSSTNAFDMRSLDALPQDIEMKKIQSCLIDLSCAERESAQSSELLQVFCNSSSEGAAKCCSPETIRVVAEKQEKLRSLLSEVSSKLKHILPLQNHQILSNIGSHGMGLPMGNSTHGQHMTAFYMSSSRTLEVEPAPAWNTSAEALDPLPSSSPTAPTLKMVKTSKKKAARQRDRKSKKTQIPVQVVKTEEEGKIPDDGFLWRKYGSKNIKTAIYKKFQTVDEHDVLQCLTYASQCLKGPYLQVLKKASDGAYYRCNHPCSQNKTKKCTAKKTVQQANNDPTVLHVAYDCPHSCKLALQLQHGPQSQEEQAKPESLTLADQMMSSSSIARMTVPSSEWSLINQFNEMRTSSKSFSAVSEDGNGQSEEGDATNMSISKRDGLGNVHTMPEFADLSGIDIDPLPDWPESPDLKILQGTRNYVDSTDIIEDHAKVLLESIMRPCSPGFQFGSMDPLADIHNWHTQYPH